MLIRLNILLDNGNYIAHEVLERNQLTFADIMAFPFIERFVVLKETIQDVWDEVNPVHVLEWFNRLSQESWIQAYRVPEHRLRNLIAKVRAGEYQGLDLPVSKYD